jgi:hypothetical protein
MSKLFGSPLTAAGLNAQEIALTLEAVEGDDMAFCESPAYEKLFEYYSCEMPYGTQKARDGDPIIWILDKIGEAHPS